MASDCLELRSICIKKCYTHHQNLLLPCTGCLLMDYHLIHMYTSINNNKKMERLCALTLVLLVTLHYSCYSLFVPGSLCSVNIDICFSIAHCSHQIRELLTSH